MSIFSAMASIIIPESDIPKLEKIANLREGEFSSLVAALRAVEPSVKMKVYASNLLKKTPELKEGDIYPIISVVMSLYRAKDSSGMDSGKVAELAIGFLSESHAARFPTEKLTLLQKRLLDLFDAGSSVMVAARSLNVLTAHEHVFLDARIFSDIRPVFADSVEFATAAVIAHNLKIGFRHNDENKEFFVALDNNDLEKLKKVIDRAEKKTKAMASILEKSQVTFLDVKEN